MIASFGCKDTEQFYHRAVRPSWLPPPLVNSALRKLDMINAAVRLSDLRSPPGNRLEMLKGRLAGFHSIRINEQWRIVFHWKDAAAHDVQIIDYH